MRLEEGAELRADDFAGAGEASALAAALVKVAGRSRAVLRPVAALGVSPLLECRVRRLVGERPVLPALVRPRAAVASGLGLALALASGALLPADAIAPPAGWVRSGWSCCPCVVIERNPVGWDAAGRSTASYGAIGYSAVAAARTLSFSAATI